ncbi:MAG TPA: hypothetical protein VF048_02540 [Gemmatimonadaceae bacterium]|jgi:hypothetical protein
MYSDDTAPDPALAFVHVLRSLRELVERRPVPDSACERQARACARLAAAAELELDDVMALAQTLLEPRLADRQDLSVSLAAAMIEEYVRADQRLARERPRRAEEPDAGRDDEQRRRASP